jgi:hypothetical protein
MNVDVVVLVLMAIADLCLLVHLRRRRARYIRMDRMTRCLQLHICSELVPDSVVAPDRGRVRQRAS